MDVSKKKLAKNAYVHEEEKILLVLLPFWNPQIPPLGMACLKSYLQLHHYCNIKIVDANTEVEFRVLFDEYYNLLKEYIPGNKQGNIFNIGNQVLRNHLMANLNYTDKKKYIELVKILVGKTFFTHIDDHQVGKLHELAREFYNIYIDENRYVKGFSFASNTLQDDDDWF